MYKKSCFAVGVVSLFFLGVVSLQAAVSISEDLIIRGTTIEVVGPGPDLQAIIDDITDEASDKPYLIKLGAGEYPLSNTVVMAEFISVMGSGPHATILKGAISTSILDATSAIVAGANNVSLTDLRVENTGGSNVSIGIFNDSDSPTIERVIVIANGGLSNYGVYNLNFSAPIMNEVTTTGDGGTAASYGVVNENNCTAIMTNVTATGKGSAGQNYGVFNSTSSPSMINVTALGLGGSIAYGVYNKTGSAPVIRHLTAEGNSGSTNYGMFNADSNDAPAVEYSSIDGASAGMRFSGSDTGTRITNTRIKGGIANDPAGTQCRDNYSETLSSVTC